MKVSHKMDNKVGVNRYCPIGKSHGFSNEPQGSWRKTLPTSLPLEVNVSPRERIFSYQCISRLSNIKPNPYMLVADSFYWLGIVYFGVALVSTQYKTMAFILHINQCFYMGFTMQWSLSSYFTTLSWNNYYCIFITI